MAWLVIVYWAACMQQPSFTVKKPKKEKILRESLAVSLKRNHFRENLEKCLKCLKARKAAANREATHWQEKER